MNNYAIGSNKKIKNLLTDIIEEKLILHPFFQRRLVWTNKNKVEFLKTIFMKYPFPEIYIANGSTDSDTAKSFDYIVDGQQRMTTIYEYFTGKNADLLDIVAYEDLSEEERRDFLNYQVVVRDLGDITEQEIITVFQRLNYTAYTLNNSERRHAQFYEGEFNAYCLSLTDHLVFEKYSIFSYNDFKRMRDQEYVAIMISTILGGYYNSTSRLDDFYRIYNDNFIPVEEINNSVINVLDFIYRLDLKSKRINQKSDFFTLFVELYNSNIVDKHPNCSSEFSKFLDQFYESVDNYKDKIEEESLYTDYYKAALQGTNTRANRIRRGSILRSKIDEFIKEYAL